MIAYILIILLKSSHGGRTAFEIKDSREGLSPSDRVKAGKRSGLVMHLFVRT